MSNDELIQLKERADQLGIQYKPNIGIEALRAKVATSLSGDGKPETDEDTMLMSAKSNSSKVSAKPEPETVQQFRDRVIKEATALVRCRITCLDPAKAHSKGEVITVGNKYTGAVSKFVSFGEDTDLGYHIPKIIYDELKQRKFNSIRSEKGANGVYHPVQRLVNAFAIEVLDPLTPAELERLARTQAAAAGQ